MYEDAAYRFLIALRKGANNMRNQDNKIQRVRPDVVYWSSIDTRNPHAPASSSNNSSNSSSVHLFKYMPRLTFAERFPVLTFLAIAFTLLAWAVMAEVEYLQGSGYFWR